MAVGEDHPHWCYIAVLSWQQPKVQRSVKVWCKLPDRNLSFLPHPKCHAMEVTIPPGMMRRERYLQDWIVRDYFWIQEAFSGVLLGCGTCALGEREVYYLRRALLLPEHDIRGGFTHYYTNNNSPAWAVCVQVWFLGARRVLEFALEKVQITSMDHKEDGIGGR